MQSTPGNFFETEKISQDEMLPDVCQDNVMVSSERYRFFPNFPQPLDQHLNRAFACLRVQAGNEFYDSSKDHDKSG